MASNVKLEAVRGVYAHVLEPFAFNEGDRKKYSLRVLIPVDSPSLAALTREIEAAKKEFAQKNGKPFPARGDIALRDADYYDGHPEYEGFKVLNASSSEKIKPLVVDEATQPVTDASVLYNGIGLNVVVKPYSYSAMGNVGVTFALQGVQIADRSAEEIGGGGRSAASLGFSNVAKDFGDLI